MLLARGRRWLGPVLFGILALVGSVSPFLRPQAVSIAENRVLARAPQAPASWAEARALPRQVDGYLADHFAFRGPLLRLALQIDRRLGAAAGPKAAVAGADGWYFLSDGLLRSTGAVADPEASADFAQFVCDLTARLQQRGARVLFTLVPSPAEIYPEHLPAWAGPLRRPTDYDRVLASARRCGVATLDLRAALWAAKGDGALYRQTDSHWTTEGATVGFNAIVRALGRPEWAADLAAIPSRRQLTSDGDLPRMAGLEPQPEDVKIYRLFEDDVTPRRQPLVGVEYRDAPPYRVAGGGAEPGVLVIGDSFTETYFAPLFGERAGRYAWVHLDDCAFDWRAIEQAQPAYVILAPTERNARCPRGRPLNMPAAGR
jgi:hypothetical protein